MARARQPKKTLDSYTVKGTNKSIKVGDCVLMRAPDSSKPPYVAKVESIEANARGSVQVRARWYYRPEESIGGRRQFHGAKEVFLSDHYDVQSADTIEGKCTVHSFKSYTKLDAVGNDDYFCRFEYKSATGSFIPDRVAVCHGEFYMDASDWSLVCGKELFCFPHENLEASAVGIISSYCKCEMPYNPDDLMIQCEGCNDWFHPPCIDMTPEDAKGVEHFYCEACVSQDVNAALEGQTNSRQADGKANNKRRRR